jgi:hypothetical protein
MHELEDKDRVAVLLRFFKNKSLKEVGAELGLNDNAARMRVDRALDKLRARLARKGVTSTTAVLVATLAANSVSAAPAAFVATLAGSSLAGAGAGGGIAFTFLRTFLTTLAKHLFSLQLKRTGSRRQICCGSGEPGNRAFESVGESFILLSPRGTNGERSKRGDAGLLNEASSSRPSPSRGIWFGNHSCSSSLIRITPNTLDSRSWSGQAGTDSLPEIQTALLKPPNKVGTS